MLLKHSLLCCSSTALSVQRCSRTSASIPALSRHKPTQPTWHVWMHRDPKMSAELAETREGCFTCSAFEVADSNMLRENMRHLMEQHCVWNWATRFYLQSAAAKFRRWKSPDRDEENPSATEMERKWKMK